ncbi:hypothetical protein AB205_0082820 [Aquarana catesbeiana]|uniref:MADF domain-containing protein n=1 Tax=Aquarana catesbeiana TaxID=8400 RepID=A0A2G9QAN0_AQUCT|nr:hypothetical protein AB205_0082820 [Aquarana catesbeiana]
MDILMRDTDFMSLFIDMLRELPCLWEITHPHFKNQAKRKAALEQLCEIVKQVIPMADITYLKILIGGLRSTYLRERKKVLDSQRSGAADDIYVPRMLYYDRLHFLAGQTEPRPSFSSLPSTLPSPPAEASDAQPGPSRPYVEEPRLSQVPPPPLKTESGSRMSALEEAAIRFFWRATEVLGAPQTRQENIAAFIAYKMQRMTEGQKAMCQALISEALEKGVSGQITPHTQLWDGPPPPPAGPPPPPPSPPGPPSPPPGPPSPPPPPPPGPTPPPATSPTAQPQPGRKCERKTRQ